MPDLDYSHEGKPRSVNYDVAVPSFSVGQNIATNRSALTDKSKSEPDRFCDAKHDYESNTIVKTVDTCENVSHQSGNMAHSQNLKSPGQSFITKNNELNWMTYLDRQG